MSWDWGKLWNREKANTFGCNKWENTHTHTHTHTHTKKKWFLLFQSKYFNESQHLKNKNQSRQTNKPHFSWAGRRFRIVFFLGEDVDSAPVPY